MDNKINTPDITGKSPSEKWENLKSFILDQIDKIDKETVYRSHEPDWWVEMSGIARTINKKDHTTTLTEKINNNPYLKVTNCTDVADLEYAMDELRKLEVEFGENNKLLLKLWEQMLDKKKKLQEKPAVSNIHPIFEQVLKPFIP